MAALPPCVLSSPLLGKARSFVAKDGKFDVLLALRSAEPVRGAGGFAAVTTMSDENYFVITLSEGKVDA